MWLLAYMMVIHFIADFLMQSREMGKQKSYVLKLLLAHIGIQFAMFLLGLWPFLGFKSALIFSLCNAAIHGIIDWNIWRGYKSVVKRRFLKQLEDEWYPTNDHSDPKFLIGLEEKSKNFKFWEDHLFFTTIGLDQLLHGLTLVLLFGILL